MALGLLNQRVDSERIIDFVCSTTDSMTIKSIRISNVNSNRFALFQYTFLTIGFHLFAIPLVLTPTHVVPIVFQQVPSHFRKTYEEKSPENIQLMGYNYETWTINLYNIEVLHIFLRRRFLHEYVWKNIRDMIPEM